MTGFGRPVLELVATFFALVNHILTLALMREQRFLIFKTCSAGVTTANIRTRRFWFTTLGLLVPFKGNPGISDRCLLKEFVTCWTSEGFMSVLHV